MMNPLMFILYSPPQVSAFHLSAKCCDEFHQNLFHQNRASNEVAPIMSSSITKALELHQSLDLSSPIIRGTWKNLEIVEQVGSNQW